MANPEWGSNYIDDKVFKAVNLPDVSGVVHIGVAPPGTCAVLTNGSIKCWGDKRNMYFGDGQDKAGSNEKVPVSVSGLSNVTDITAGKFHSCALINDGTVKCWGENDNGQLGDNTTGLLRSTPVSVSGLSGVSDVTAGDGFTCARLSDGTVKCWGIANRLGNDLDGSESFAQLTPVSVSDLTGASQISSRSKSTCVVISGNAVKCWGYNNNYGQLGSTDTFNRLTPVQVGE
jgi:alpha-tubulin suppressor-like RCC1 family protein